MANSSLPLSCNDRPVFSKSLPQINAQYHWTEKMAFSFVIAIDFFDFGDKKPLTVRTRRGSMVSFSVFGFCVQLGKPILSAS